MNAEEANRLYSAFFQDAEDHFASNSKPASFVPQLAHQRAAERHALVLAIQRDRQRIVALLLAAGHDRNDAIISLIAGADAIQHAARTAAAVSLCERLQEAFETSGHPRCPDPECAGMFDQLDGEGRLMPDHSEGCFFAAFVGAEKKEVQA